MCELLQFTNLQQLELSELLKMTKFVNPTHNSHIPDHKDQRQVGGDNEERRQTDYGEKFTEMIAQIDQFVWRRFFVEAFGLFD